MKLAAQASHYALYALMIGMSLIGWGMLSAAGYPEVLLGELRLPAILPHSASVHAMFWSAHLYLAFAFFALILLHVAAALFHALIRQDGVFEAMAPACFGIKPRPQRDRGQSDPKQGPTSSHISARARPNGFRNPLLWAKVGRQFNPPSANRARP